MWLTQNLLSEGDLASVFLRVDLFSLNKVECGIPKYETDESITALAEAGWIDPKPAFLLFHDAFMETLETQIQKTPRCSS